MRWCKANGCPKWNWIIIYEVWISHWWDHRRNVNKSECSPKYDLFVHKWTGMDKSVSLSTTSRGRWQLEPSALWRWKCVSGEKMWLLWRAPVRPQSWWYRTKMKQEPNASMILPIVYARKSSWWEQRWMRQLLVSVSSFVTVNEPPTSRFCLLSSKFGRWNYQHRLLNVSCGIFVSTVKRAAVSRLKYK